MEPLVLGNGITAVPNYAFYKCGKLVSVTLGDSVATIGECAFKNCLTLPRITLPKTLKIVGDKAFRFCYALSCVYSLATTPPLAVVTDDGWLAFDCNDIERLIYVPSSSVEAYKLADGWIEYANSIVGYNFE